MEEKKLTILETAILFKEKSLCEEHFYSSEDALSEEDREFLAKAVNTLVKTTFDDKIHKFSMGEYKILIKLKNLKLNKDGDGENPPLAIYCIAEKKADQNLVNNCMEDAIIQFLNQFSINDIVKKDPSKFKKFNKQLKKIFKEIALKPEDRFKSILF